MLTKKATIIFFLVLFMGTAIYSQAQAKTILFVTREDDEYFDPIWDNYSDYPFMLALESQGYTINKLYNTSLSTASQATIDSLNEADLVIIGRSTPSTMYQDPNKVTWNDITAPVLNLSLWTVRSSRLNWFNSTAAVNIDDELLYNATIDLPDDPVFEGIDVSGEVPWAQGPVSLLQEVEAGNGIVLAREAVNQWVLFVRFEPGVEFYDGSVDIPAGHRTLLGNGNDNGRTAEGAHIFNFYNFTLESEKVFLAEVERMLALGDTPVEKQKNTTSPDNYNLSQNYPNPFNPSTTIEFSLLKSGYTTVKVFNAVGQLIETLVDNNLEAGLHTIHFHAHFLPAGVYFYEIKSNNFSNLKKMILLK